MRTGRRVLRSCDHGLLGVATRLGIGDHPVAANVIMASASSVGDNDA